MDEGHGRRSPPDDSLYRRIRSLEEELSALRQAAAIRDAVEREQKLQLNQTLDAIKKDLEFCKEKLDKLRSGNPLGVAADAPALAIGGGIAWLLSNYLGGG